MIKITCDCGHTAEYDESEIYSHRLICGDSTDKATVELLMDGKKAFLCVTDPPYNTNNGAKDELLAEFRPNERVKKTDKVHLINDNMSTDAFCLFLKKVFENMRDSLVVGGHFIFGTLSVLKESLKMLSIMLDCKFVNSLFGLRIIFLWVCKIMSENTNLAFMGGLMARIIL